MSYRLPNLANLFDVELIAVFAGFLKVSQPFDLSENHLYHKTGEKLTTAYAGIPQGVTTLNLRDNFLL